MTRIYFLTFALASLALPVTLSAPSAHASDLSAAVDAYCKCMEPISEKTAAALKKMKDGDEKAASAITQSMSKDLQESFECQIKTEKAFSLSGSEKRDLKKRAAKKCPQPSVDLR